MATPTKTRLKTKAQLDVPQSRDEAAQYIRRIGDMTRKMLRDMAEMNDAIAHITQTYQPRLDAQKGDISLCQQGLQAWCEANRDELTNSGRVKTANLVTGEIQWRQRPPSVGVRGAESVIEALMGFGLDRFVRMKAEINKEAILNEPDAVKGVAGITVVTGVEDFVITPFEQDAV